MAEKMGSFPEKDPDEGTSMAGLPEDWEVPSGRAGGPTNRVSRTAPFCGIDESFGHLEKYTYVHAQCLSTNLGASKPSPQAHLQPPGCSPLPSPGKIMVLPTALLF